MDRDDEAVFSVLIRLKRDDYGEPSLDQAELEREFVIDNLPIRIHLIIAMVW